MYAFTSSSGYHTLKFIAVDLQLYKIFKITLLSFSGAQCIYAINMMMNKVDVKLNKSHIAIRK